MNDTVQQFRSLFGREGRAFIAPGRVNLIGEHTDYNEGFVLPMAIDKRTIIVGAARDDARVCVESTTIGARREFSFDEPWQGRTNSWIDYVEGTARTLRQRGHDLRGADILIDSDIPAGAGLSSSAALEVGVGLCLLELSGCAVDRQALALAAQAAEHEYVGTRCGIMDQYVVALAKRGHALLVDCRTLAPAWVPLDPRTVAFLIADTGVKHTLAGSEYNTRREECEAAVAILRERLPDVRSLRDVSSAELSRHAAALPDVLRRRSRHVVSENERTLEAADALRAGDWSRMGALMVASHASLRDDYEVSVPELDVLVDAARQVPGVFGSRMTGGGFGGSTISLVEVGAADELRRVLAVTMEKRFGRAPAMFVTTAAEGASVSAGGPRHP